MKYFQCPHCGQPITAHDVPPDVRAAINGSIKSAAKTAAARANAKLPRKPRTVKSPIQIKPVPAAPDNLVQVVAAVEPDYQAELVKPVLETLTLAEAKAKAEKLKPLVVNKVRDYSGAYS